MVWFAIVAIDANTFPGCGFTSSNSTSCNIDASSSIVSTVPFMLEMSFPELITIGSIVVNLVLLSFTFAIIPSL